MQMTHIGLIYADYQFNVNLRLSSTRLSEVVDSLPFWMATNLQIYTKFWTRYFYPV